MTKRNDKSKPRWGTLRCDLLASVLGPAMWLASTGATTAADYLPGKVPVRVGADSSQVCTFWTGLGTDEYFFVSDFEGDPLPMSAWLQWADPKELTDLFETLYGFAWITSRRGSLLA